jgi:Helix-turn-helix domain
MAPEIGQTLRQARIDRGLELSDVSDETKIRTQYLAAIEDERWEVLPGDPYNRAFVVTYAELLELDPEPLVAEYRRAHREADEPEPIPESMLPQRGMLDRAPLGWRPAPLLLALAAAAALVLVAIVALSGDSEEGGGKAPRHAASPQHGDGSSNTTSSESHATRPAKVSLELRATESVWVCLIDDRGDQLIDAEILPPNEARGPFKARAFKATFGNGAVQITVDHEPVAVPDPGEPFGYRITPKGVSDLRPDARPTCI